MLDVFTTKKRSKRGKCIRFVRFWNVHEAQRAIWRLNGFWLLNNRIGVNMARFNPRSAYWKTITIGVEGGRIKVRTFKIEKQLTKFLSKCKN